MRTPHRGFTLLETMIALLLVAIAMTALLLAFINSGKYGVLSRRQATALTVARSQAELLSRVPWPPPILKDAGGVPTGVTPVLCDPSTIDSRLANNNTGNDTADTNGNLTGSFADPNGLFAKATLPTGSDQPDNSLGTIKVGNESYDAYVNVAPHSDKDSSGTAVLDGMQFAVIVRYKVGDQFMRAVALGYRYCPLSMSVGQLPL
jgi:prepilin-type N-terminal cleavage/methylation domain-containing protein